MKPANKMTDFADWKRNLARDVLELDSDYDSEDEPEYDADPDMEVLFEDYMMPAVSAGKIDRINHILASFDIDEAMLSEIYGGSTLMCVAAGKGYTEVVKLLIDYAADVDETDDKKWTPLMHATANRHEKLAIFLFEEHDAGVFDSTDDDGFDALYLAAREGLSKLMKSMVESELDTNHLYGDETPMLIAARLGHHDVVAELVKHVDNIDECGDDYRTALDHAVESGRYDIVKTLFECDEAPDLEWHDKNHDNSLLRAVRAFFKNPEYDLRIIKLLLEHGAEVDQKLTDDMSALDIAVSMTKAGKPWGKELVDCFKEKSYAAGMPGRKRDRDQYITDLVA